MELFVFLCYLKEQKSLLLFQYYSKLVYTSLVQECHKISTFVQVETFYSRGRKAKFSTHKSRCIAQREEKNLIFFISNLSCQHDDDSRS